MKQNALSTENYVVVLKDGTMLYVNEQQAKIVGSAMSSVSSDSVVYIDKTIVNKSAISYVAPIAVIEETLRRKRGEWKCEMGHWHRKDEQVCAEMIKREEEMVDLEDGNRVHISEIIADRKLKKENQIYERDEQRKIWRRVGTKNV